MSRGIATRAPNFGVALLFAGAGLCSGAPIHFESAAQLHRTLRKPVQGTFILDETGAEFRGPKRSHRWTYGDIKTFTLSGSKALTLTDYENRHWHEPGEQKFEFTLATPIAPSLAAELTAMVARPVINGDPEPKTPTFAEIAAHRRERFGGSNGMLRFRDDGIDYTTPNGRDARSWRWSDIQTIATSDPWQFRVTAYREIVEFDLKQPISRELFDRLWDKLYGQDLNLTPGNHGGRQ
jgi:hypothetical protein